MESDSSEIAAESLEGRLLARPRPVIESWPTGLHQLGIGGNRDGLLYVPATYELTHPSPLILMLHGAGSSGQRGMAGLLPFADEYRLILLAPDSRQVTWDVLHGGFGPDIVFINRALEQTFSRYAVDPDRVAVEGFSDGASYALSIGITNGDHFSRIAAFSPGFIVPGAQRGAPPVFISHGVNDRVLPIERCGRRIAEALAEAEYEVTYREFDGGHEVPPEIAAEVARWLTGTGDQPRT